jgi:hypothetical protein
MSWFPCNAILAAIYGDLAMEPRGWQPHPVADGPFASCRVCDPLTARSNHQRRKGCWGVACLFKNADLSDEIDYV